MLIVKLLALHLAFIFFPKVTGHTSFFPKVTGYTSILNTEIRSCGAYQCPYEENRSFGSRESELFKLRWVHCRSGRQNAPALPSLMNR